LVSWHSVCWSLTSELLLSCDQPSADGWVTTYVGKPSTIGKPTRPTQHFILLGRLMSSKLQLDVVTTVHGRRHLVNTNAG